MTKDELLVSVGNIVGSELRTKRTDEIKDLMTVTQYVTDICLNELQDRGEIEMYQGSIVVPYMCDYMVETVLAGRPI